MSPSDRKAIGQMTAEEAKEKGTARMERDLQAQIVQYLHLLEVEVLWHRTDRKSHATTGWPDLTFVVDGKPWGVEVKTDTGRVRPEQYERLRKMGLNGWQVAIVRSFEEFKKVVFQEEKELT